MENLQNIIEYYDELYPVSDSQREFFDSLIKEYPQPAKLLRVGCGTGLFEHQLAREGLDVTGIDSSQELLRSANLRRRNQLMSVRFFEMSYMDMARFLGKGFYNIISCLEDWIIFIHDETLLKKFLYDCKQLLTPDGKVVLQLTNYSNCNTSTIYQLPVRESIRAHLFTELIPGEGECMRLTQNLESGNGRMFSVRSNHPVRILRPAEIEKLAKDSGFSKVEFFADYKKNALTDESEGVVAVLS